MTINVLIHQFQFNQFVLTKILERISQEESLRVVAPEEKCLNWTLGHLLVSRGDLLSRLNAEPFWTAPEAAPYRAQTRGLEPVNAKTIEELRQVLDDSLARITRALQSCQTPLDQPIEGGSPIRGTTLGEQIATFVCHEAYHMGQIGLMRRLLGKEGVF